MYKRPLRSRSSHAAAPGGLPTFQTRWRGRIVQGSSQASQHHRHVCHAAQAQDAPAASADGPAMAADVVSLGNLCVDIIREVDALPPADTEARKELLATLTAEPPSEDLWQVGGGCNFMITAARLGLQVGCCGNVGQDRFGDFLKSTLQAEGIQYVRQLVTAGSSQPLLNTLLCFVLVVRRTGAHAFCSAYDFGPWPLLSDVSVDQLNSDVVDAFQHTKAVMANGFVFDELAPDIVARLFQHSQQAGAAIFFDPGPRSASLMESDRAEALHTVLDAATVIMLTAEEAAKTTGCSAAGDACRHLLERPGSVATWVVIKQGEDGATLACRDVEEEGGAKIWKRPAYNVLVEDTVGCGDSFAAAIVLGYLKGADPEVVLTLANAVGAATATSRGAGCAVADLRMVHRILQQAAHTAPDRQTIHLCRQADSLLKSVEKDGL